MGKSVVILEDDPDLVILVRELLHDEEYAVYSVETVDDLLLEVTLRSPCVALLDSTNASHFDLWDLGERLSRLGVPPLAFTAHASARGEFEQDPRGFAGVISKPFDADEFLTAVNSICLEDYQRVAS